MEREDQKTPLVSMSWHLYRYSVICSSLVRASQTQLPTGYSVQREHLLLGGGHQICSSCFSHKPACVLDRITAQHMLVLIAGVGVGKGRRHGTN